MILIGSHAALFHGVPLGREPHDIDVVVNDSAELDALAALDPKGLRRNEHPGKYGVRGDIEIDASRSDSNLMLEAMLVATTQVGGLTVRVPSVEALFLIKRSHAGHDVFWDKTMFDLHHLRKALTRPFTEAEQAFLAARKREADERFAGKRSKMNFNVPNEAFFTAAVERHFEHDELHRRVARIAYGDTPMHERIRRDPNTPKCDQDLFEILSFDDKCRTVREETMVIALERFLIPGKTRNRHIAYRKALRVVALRLTRNWFQDFIIDNYETLTRCDKDFWSEIEEELGV